MKQDARQPNTWRDQALALQGESRHGEAVEAYRKHLEIHPEDAEAWGHLGGELCNLDRLEDSADACRRALSLNPRSVTGHFNLGMALSRQRAFAAAEGHFLQVLAVQPKDVFARLALAECLMQLERPVEALAQFERVLAVDPKNGRAFGRMASIHHLSGNRTGLKETLDRWIQADPESPDRLWERSVLHLLEGEYAKGWEEFEARLEIRDQPRTPIGPFPQPRWDGSPFPGKTLLLHWEQGFGDTLMFIRFAKQAKALGGRVVALVQPPLVGLVATCEGVDEVVAHGQPLPPFDCYLPLMSLPWIFHVEEDTIPADVPYLRVPEQSPNRRLLEGVLSVPTRRLKVGYAWAGSSGNLGDASRSIPPACLAPLGDLPEVNWICLQLPAPSEPPIRSVPLSPLLSDFSDTAYALSQVDLVLTVDTALAHLAGALGLPTFLMLRYGSEWRWQMGRSDSPWYPTMRIYRQPRPDDWDSVIRQIIGDLTGGGSEGDTPEPLPESTEELAAKGLELVKAERFEEAEPLLRLALVERSDDIPLRLAHVECLLRSGDLGLALRHLDRVLRSEPAHFGALQRMLDVYTACRDRLGVIRTLDRWLAVDPHRPDLRWERGTMHLMEGHYLQGWEDIEARFEVKDQIVSMMEPFQQPRWDGSPFPGKTLLLHWEQGLGDTLMFIRFAKQVKALGGRVVAVVQPGLVDLVAACEGIDEALADEAPLPPFDLHLPLMSLPRVLRIDEHSIPAEVPYLRIPEVVPNREALHRLLSAPTENVRIGYVWAGSPRHLNDAIRSMPPEVFAKLGALPGVTWHCFQLPVPATLPLPSVEVSPLLRNFSDSAYAMGFMDLVITVDTAAAHLAGALGIPTFLLVAFGSEWRWQWDRRDCPWYPTLRIYRQPEPGDWDTPIREILADLSGQA
ncbi:MAG TPA: tetratricopeptide repeat protein [Holophagaceae bacterium]|nr:tetratricopeptide repeat protein [Holophagaceae bacterium]